MAVVPSSLPPAIRRSVFAPKTIWGIGLQVPTTSVDVAGSAVSSRVA
ncbi:hypothetical protein OHU11_09395 [Streptomyces sp. NBC_00257]|nr:MULTISPECIES: hypothetical protein [unclassified Streptomyces]MCX5427887.1 hypothetical protein [Streptomyces sp. NBC_00062]